MDLLRNELLKFHRSHVWTVIVFIPLIAVAVGAANYTINSSQLDNGWGSYFSQILLFYGLAFMTVGIAIISASAWRFEHRGHNWHTLMTSTRSTGDLIASKIGSVAVLVTAMQMTLLILSLITGCCLSVPGPLPRSYIIAIILALAPGIAVASWQLFLSMLIRNFATPIAIALIFCVASIGALGANIADIKYILPPALVTSSISLGSTAVSTAGTLDAGTVIVVLCTSAIMTFLGWLASLSYLNHFDIRL